jgi:hypothetical protein
MKKSEKNGLVAFKKNALFEENNIAVVPGVCCQSLLFMPISSERDRGFDEKRRLIQMFCNEKYKIEVSKWGPDLDQRDLSLVLWLLSIADSNLIAKFTLNQALKNLGLSACGTNYEWLEDSIDRMRRMDIRFFMKNEKTKEVVIYDGMLISSKEIKTKEDKEIKYKKEITVQLNSFAKVLVEDKFTYMSLEERKKIRSSQLACFLYGWFKSNRGQKVFYLKQEKIMEKLRKPKEENRDFIKRLKKTGLDPLVKLGILIEYSIEDGVLTLVWDDKYENKQKKLDKSEKIKLNKKLYGTKKVSKKKPKDDEEEEESNYKDSWA